MSETQTRHCPGWQEIEPHDLPASEFYSDAKRTTGYSAYCKSCHSARMRAYWKMRYYPEHAEKQKAAVVKRRIERKEEAKAL